MLHYVALQVVGINVDLLSFQILMNAWRHRLAAFPIRNASTFQDLSSVDVKMDSLSEAMAAVNYSKKVVAVVPYCYASARIGRRH